MNKEFLSAHQTELSHTAPSDDRPASPTAAVRRRPAPGAAAVGGGGTPPAAPAAQRAFAGYIHPGRAGGGRSAVLSLAEALADFNAALKPATAAAAATMPVRTATMAAQLAMQACVTAAMSLDLPPQDRFRISAAASVIFECGRAALGAQRAALAALHGGGGGGLRALGKEANLQLTSAFVLVDQLLAPHEAASAAFARSAGKPEALLPWLQELLLALELAAPEVESAGLASTASLSICTLLHRLLGHPAYARHATAIQGTLLAGAAAHVPVRRQVWVQWCLPVAAAAAADSPSQLLDADAVLHALLSKLKSCLGADSLEAAVAHCLGWPGAGAAAVEQAARIAALLPSRRPEGVEAGAYANSLAWACIMLQDLCAALCDSSAPVQMAAAPARQQAARMLASATGPAPFAVPATLAAAAKAAAAKAAAARSWLTSSRQPCRLCGWCLMRPSALRHWQLRRTARATKHWNWRAGRWLTA
ncbi:hypothetical protein ABPG75_010086 [Micractinium tetrahymenae]